MSICVESVYWRHRWHFPWCPLHAAGDKAREGMRHLLFLTLATSDCWSRLQGKANAIWVQESRFSDQSPDSVYVCIRSVSSVQLYAHVSAAACCSICTVGRAAMMQAGSRADATWEVSSQTSAPAWLTPAWCTLTSQLHYSATSSTQPACTVISEPHYSAIRVLCV